MWNELGLYPSKLFEPSDFSHDSHEESHAKHESKSQDDNVRFFLEPMFSGDQSLSAGARVYVD